MRRNETLKNLSRETVKRASVHEMLFSFCATYSPELPLCFSMKPVRRARPVFAPDTHTLAAHPLHLAMCNGLRVNPPPPPPPVEKPSRKKSGLFASVIVTPRRCHPSTSLADFFSRAIKERARRLFLANDCEREHDGNFTSTCYLFNYEITKLFARVALHGSSSGEISRAPRCPREGKVILSRGGGGNIASFDARYVLTFFATRFPRFFKATKQ